MISEIFPASQKNASGRIINGTMINPIDSGTQGYDSASRDMSYDNALHLDPGNTGATLIAKPGSSIIKSISMESTDGRPIISDAVIVTVLLETPPSESFRPGYIGNDKSILATKANLNYKYWANMPNLVESLFLKMWQANMSEYGWSIIPIGRQEIYTQRTTCPLMEGI